MTGFRARHQARPDSTPLDMPNAPRPDPDDAADFELPDQQGRSRAQKAAGEGWTAARSLQRKDMLTLDRNVILTLYDLDMNVLYQIYSCNIQKFCVEYPEIMAGISKKL